MLLTRREARALLPGGEAQMRLPVSSIACDGPHSWWIELAVRQESFPDGNGGSRPPADLAPQVVW